MSEDEAARFRQQAEECRQQEGLFGVVGAMDSAQRCRDQAAECLRLVKLAQSKHEAEVLRNISSSWTRLCWPDRPIQRARA